MTINTHIVETIFYLLGSSTHYYGITVEIQNIGTASCNYRSAQLLLPFSPPQNIVCLLRFFCR